MSSKKNFPISRGEKMISLVRSAPPYVHVPGTVWEKYEKHEHDSFFRVIGRKELDKLNEYFSSAKDKSCVDDGTCAPVPAKSSLPPGTMEGSIHQHEVNSTSSIPDTSDMEVISHLDGCCTKHSSASSEGRIEDGVTNDMASKEENGFPDPGHANGCLSTELLPLDEVNVFQPEYCSSSNILHAADGKTFFSLVPVKLPLTQPSDTPLDMEVNNILPMMDQTKNIPLPPVIFNEFSSAGNETVLPEEPTPTSPKRYLEYGMDSDDSFQDPDFNMEECDDYGSDDSLGDRETQHDNKGNKRTKKRKNSQDPELKIDSHLENSGEGVVLRSIENTMVQALTETGLDQPAVPKKGRKKNTDPSTWKRNLAKRLRNEGKEYVSRNTKNPVSARAVKPPCSEKCIYKCFEKFTPEERKRLFDMYWGLGDVTRQREFITKQSASINPEYRYPKAKPRQLNHAFYFSLDGSKRRVCKTFFMATLDINRRTVATAFGKEEDGIVKVDLRGKHCNHIQVPDHLKQGVRAHINSIPRIESHYLRKNTSREYIEGGKSVKSLYRDYNEQREKANEGVCTESMYRFIFDHEFNISFFVPKKDQCETCVVYNLADDEKKASLKSDYDLHIEEKDLARLEKLWDKEHSNDNVIVCCYDLQAAFPTPQGEASVFYYKSKLSTYNLTIYDLKTGEAVNNVWHEGDANRGANEIASCVYKFIEQKATATDKDLKFVFYSDNCSGQQKNKYVFVMYMLCLRKFRNIRSISHKFLITGHTQNEGDSVHSVIEKAVKRARKTGPVYIPGQFVQIIRTAKVRPPFYVVNEMSFKDVFDFKTLANNVGGTFNKNTTNAKFPFSDIKSFIITQQNPFTFYYRTAFGGELQAVDIWGSDPNEPGNASSSGGRKSKRLRTSTPKSDEKETPREKSMKILSNWNFKPAYTSPTGISQNKKNDLMSLLNSGVVPEIYRSFYEEIVTRNNNAKKSIKFD